MTSEEKLARLREKYGDISLSNVCKRWAKSERRGRERGRSLVGHAVRTSDRGQHLQLDWSAQRTLLEMKTK